MSSTPLKARELVSRGHRFDAGWLAWPGMHGGYVMAAAARAAAGLAGGLPLRAMNTRFLRAIEPRRVVIRSALEHTSRTTATVSVRIDQDDQTAAISTCTFAAPDGALSFVGRPAPEVPGPEGCEVFRDAELLYAFARQLEIRPATAILPLSGSDQTELTAWLRLREEHSHAEGLLILADAMPPAIYATLDLPIPVPSLEIAVHLAGPSAFDQVMSGWLLAQQRNVSTGGGLSIDECDLWDEAGNFVGQTRQLRRVIESAALSLEG